jgi:UDP:flavonoid glycosyltransferase YjiC (YdhE family)
MEVRREPADLPATLSGTRTVVCYASHAVTLAALMAGKPLLLLPDHPEQRRTADRVLALGAGLKIEKDERPGRVASGLKRILEEAAFREAARRFEEAQPPDDGSRALARAAAACERAVAPSTAQLKLVQS